jgi:aldehyde dehydrogenase (NAD+)
LARFYAEAGFPPGVVQFVSGAGATGALLSSHKQIAKISITGSIGAGVKVQEQATKSNLKKVVLELGGKSPAIIFEDADLPTALGCASHGFLFNSGQICAATSRLYVQESESLGADPLLKTTALGPLADKMQMDRVLYFIEEGKKSATLLTGGKRKGDKGCFVEPTLFTDPAPDNVAYKDEIFGPVLFVRTFKTEKEALALANDSTFGLIGMCSAFSLYSITPLA